MNAVEDVLPAPGEVSAGVVHDQADRCTSGTGDAFRRNHRTAADVARRPPGSGRTGCFSGIGSKLGQATTRFAIVAASKWVPGMG
jgi:hypothetical protein